MRLDAAKLALERAEKLLANQTGSERAVEEARAAHQLAKAAHEQATAKRALLGPGFAARPTGNVGGCASPSSARMRPRSTRKPPATITPQGTKATHHCQTDRRRTADARTRRVHGGLVF